MPAHSGQASSDGPSILVLAYACEPDKGSEPGAGWLWARMLARVANVLVVTRSNNQAAIEQALPNISEANRLSFIYVEPPAILRRLKQGQRGIRTYYTAWQLSAIRAARREMKFRRFDMVWHLTLATAWLGSVGGLFGVPFVFGPVGGGISTPRRLLWSLGIRGLASEIARITVRGLNRALNPMVRLAWRRAQVILAQNPETREWFPAKHRHKIRIVQNAVAPVDADGAPVQPADRLAIYVGRLLPWKGVAFAIRAVKAVPDWRLVIIGTGPDEKRLRRIAANSEGRIEFRGWIPYSDVRLELQRAAILLFPSVHDDSPLAVAEALTAGVPVACLDIGGPKLIAGPAAITVSANQSATAVIDDLVQILRNNHLPSAETIDGRAAEIGLPGRARLVEQLVDEFHPPRPTKLQGRPNA